MVTVSSSKSTVPNSTIHTSSKKSTLPACQIWIMLFYWSREIISLWGVLRTVETTIHSTTQNDFLIEFCLCLNTFITKPAYFSTLMEMTMFLIYFLFENLVCKYYIYIICIPSFPPNSCPTLPLKSTTASIIIIVTQIHTYIHYWVHLVLPVVSCACL